MRTVAVSGVGTVIGYGILRALRQMHPEVRSVGLDASPDASGREAADEFQVAPLVTAPNYFEFLRDVMSRYAVDLYIPGIPQDVRALIGSPISSGLPAPVVLNSPALFEIADDKWRTHEAVTAAGIPAIPTCIHGCFGELVEALGLPFLLKPRRGASSQGIRKIESARDFAYWGDAFGSLTMAQQIVGTDDEEYTVGVFGVGGGAYSQMICLRRRLSYEGSTARAWVVEDRALEDEVRRLVKLFVPIGPTNMQFRKHGDRFLLLEVNPRISSSTSIRAAFGYNEAEMCWQYFVEHRTPTPVVLRRGMAVRYLEDRIRYESGTG